MSKTVIDSPFPSAKRVAKKLKLSPSRVRRLDVMVSEILNENLDALAMGTGIHRGEHVRRAIAQYIEMHGFDPNERPKRKAKNK